MSGIRRVHLNLATQPLRNRRFFLTLLSASAGLVILVALLSGWTSIRSGRRERSARSSLAQTQKMIQASQKERNEWVAQVSGLSKKEKEKIEAVNGIIAKRAFSWVNFFTQVEDALPPGSYIAWIAPLMTGESRVDVRIKVVSQNLADLLALIQRLNASGFKNISVRQETSAGAQLTSEISFSHERTP